MGQPVVPIHREVIADRITPVLAQATLGDAPGSYLLESVTGGETWARYSFVGFAPEIIVRGVADRFERVQDGEVHQELDVDPWERLRETLAEWKPPEVDWAAEVLGRGRRVRQLRRRADVRTHRRRCAHT